MHQVVSLLEKAESTLRENAAAASITLYRYEGNETIRRLVCMGMIKNRTTTITLITLDGVKRLCMHLVNHGRSDIAGLLVEEIKALLKSSHGPPPLRYQLGYEQPQPLQEDEPQAERKINAVAHTFPSAPPEVILLPSQQRSPYALDIVPRGTLAEINQFIAWSAAPINTTRSSM